MYCQVVTVTNKSGLHARPAMLFVTAAAKFACEVSVRFKEKTLNAKSILMMLSAGIHTGSIITICASGEQEQEAVQTLVAMTESGFGE